ncbi:MAG: hypothetical protein D6693_00090 [Planctomycetota bacterium]|nr:MAG: hypothetical protein D6693_00090 [Planctomycetota bacterium]
MRRGRPVVGLWSSIALAVCAACAAGSALAGQPPASESDAGGATATGWRARAARASDPPVIDGVLDDPAWTLADPIDDFTQVDPDEGAAPSQRTVARIVYDEDNLYIGIRCYDDEPGRIIGKELRRDGNLGSDDRVSVVIDPYGTSRDGFIFQLSVTGARRDGLVENNRRFRIEWDGIWWGRTSRDGEGWSAEFRIPVKTLSFSRRAEAWGLNIERSIRRLNERVRWATPIRNSSIRRLDDAGALVGLEGLNQGLGLDVKPSVSLTLNDGGPTLLEPALDVFYKLTPEIQATLTLNTDFAETEVDDRQVNLTRFPLFFPEKRDFFLQDAGVFEFGGINRTPLPFFSRRIGIVGGEEKEILGGFKVTGRTERLTFGVLDVQMKDDPVLGSKNLAVARARYNVSDTAAVGLIATNGDPATTGDNTVVGVDYDFLIDDVGGGNTLQGSGYLMRSFSSGSGAEAGGDGLAFGARVNYPNEPWSFNAFFGQVDAGFNPALGFAPRRGEREAGGGTRWRWRPEDSWIRRIDLSVNMFLNLNLSNDVISMNSSLPRLEIESQAGDRVGVFLSPQREKLERPFEISDGVVIPVDGYDYLRYGADFSTSSGRPISGRASVTLGDFFGGTRQDVTAGVDWRPSKHFFLGVELIQNDVNLPQGSFITRIGRVRLNINFTPDLSWSNFIQYDNVSDTAGLNSRLKWTIRPGSDLFIVLNQGFFVTSDTLRLEETALTTKIGWTFRF